MIKKTRKHLSHDEKIVEKRKQLAAKGKVAAIWTRVSSADQFISKKGKNEILDRRWD